MPIVISGLVENYLMKKYFKLNLGSYLNFKYKLVSFSDIDNKLIEILSLPLNNDFQT